MGDRRNGSFGLHLGSSYPVVIDGDHAPRSLPNETDRTYQQAEESSRKKRSREGYSEESIVNQVMRVSELEHTLSDLKTKIQALEDENQAQRIQIEEYRSRCEEIERERVLWEEQASKHAIGLYMEQEKILQQAHEVSTSKVEIRRQIELEFERRKMDSVMRPESWEGNSGLVRLLSNGEEYRRIEKKFLDSLGCSAVVSSIERVQNERLWKRYVIHRDESVKIENHGNANERQLFHASRSPSNVANEGLDERHSSLKGRFGQGIYFAETAQKSSGYGGHQSMFLCLVSLGNMLDTRTSQYQGIPKPIQILPKPWHSVVVTHLGPMNELVVYRMEQAYPQYLIKYRLGS